MPELFLYLIKVNISLILFCLAYYFVMRRLTYYKLNRGFLLGGIILSTIYPLLDFSVLLKESPKLMLDVQRQLPLTLQQTSEGTDPWSILLFCFWTGVVITGLKMVIRLYSLFKIHRHSIPSTVNSYAVRLLKGSMSTFSFWNNIYLNPDQHQKDELAAILKHEQVHVKDFHTFDILLAEVATVFYWFNPGAWLIRKAIKENVEFITDEKTLKIGVDRKAYQYSMLKTSTGLDSSQLITNFNVTAAKRRIVMMNSKRTSPLYLLSYLLVLLSIVFAISAFNVIKVEKVSAKIKMATPDSDAAEKITRLIKLERPDVPANHVKTISLNNKTAKVSVIKLKRAAVKDLKIEQKEMMPADAFVDNKVDSESGANHAPAKINSIKIIGTGKIQNSSIDNVKTYIDDVEVTSDQLKSLDTKLIVSINVKKNQGPDEDAIYIYTKPAKN